MTNEEKIQRINDLVEAGVLTQEEADAKIKPLEDAIAAEKAAAEEAEKKAKEEEEKVAAEKKSSIEEIKKQISEAEGSDAIERYFEVLVPSSGPADTVAGELVRAMMKVLYRDYNDGDRFYEGYGLETCGPAAAFLAENTNSEIEEKLGEICEEGFIDSEYTRGINEVADMLVDFIESNEELLAEPNDKDMLESDASGWEDMAPTYEIEIQLPDEVEAHLDAHNITENDLVDEIDYWEWNGKSRNEEFSLNWSNELYIEGLTREGYDDWEENGSRWLEQFGEQLTEQYGDPNYDPDISIDTWVEALINITGEERGNVRRAAEIVKHYFETPEIGVMEDTISDIRENEEPVNDENFVAYATDWLSDEFIHNPEAYKNDFLTEEGITEEDFNNLIVVCGGVAPQSSEKEPAEEEQKAELEKQEADGNSEEGSAEEKTESLNTKVESAKSSEDEYREFVKVLKDRDISFHPDDDFKDYINYETKKPTFTEEEAEELNSKMDAFFDKLGDKVYSIAADVYGLKLESKQLNETVQQFKVGDKVQVFTNSQDGHDWINASVKEITTDGKYILDLSDAGLDGKSSTPVEAKDIKSREENKIIAEDVKSGAPLKSGMFATEDNICYAGYNTGLDWNGAAVPAFTKNVALKIAEDVSIMSNGNTEITFDEQNDRFIETIHEYDADVTEENPDANKVFIEGKDYVTDDGVQHCYCIGGFEWMWAEVSVEEEQPVGNFEFEEPVEDIE